MAGLALIAALGGLAGAAEPQRFAFSGRHMGIEFKLLLYSEDADVASAAAKRAFARIGELDARLSDYDAESELNRLCEKAGGPPVAASDDLYRVLDRSLYYWRETDGTFDPTVAPVIRLWRRARREKALPDPAKLEATRALVGAGDVSLDPAKKSVRLARKGMRLDFGGIAKGYAADEAYKVLADAGCPIALVAAEGDIRAGHAPPGRPGWRVKIAPPSQSNQSPWDDLILKDRAVSTSGDTTQYVEIDGVRYSHIVDPRTGQALTRRGAVTVVANDATSADAIATAFAVLGPEASFRLAPEFKVEALFVTAGGEKDVVETTPGFDGIPKAGPEVP